MSRDPPNMSAYTSCIPLLRPCLSILHLNLRCIVHILSGVVRVLYMSFGFTISVCILKYIVCSSSWFFFIIKHRNKEKKINWLMTWFVSKCSVAFQVLSCSKMIKIIL